MYALQNKTKLSQLTIDILSKVCYGVDSKDSHEIAIFIKTLKSTLSAQEIIKNKLIS